MPSNNTPKALLPLFQTSFTPFISNGNAEHRCCRCCRVFGYENTLEECAAVNLFPPESVERSDNESDVVDFGRRILDELRRVRNDVAHMVCVLPSSPYEGLEFREKLKECDRLGAAIHEAERQRSLLHDFAAKKAEHHRLSDLLPHLQAQAERAGEEKSRKEHTLNRKKLRIQVLQEEASDRLLRLEERAERRHVREMQGMDSQRLLPRPRESTIRRIRQVEIPGLEADIVELERDIVELEKTIDEYRRTRDRVRDLNAYLSQTPAPDLDEHGEENDRQRLRRIRRDLKQRSPRMFNHLLADVPEDHVHHEKDFDNLYELIENGSCPCGTPFASHLVLLKPQPNESAKLEEQLLAFVEANRDVNTNN